MIILQDVFEYLGVVFIFSWFLSFIEYKRIYVGEKFYKCEECGKVFNRFLIFIKYKIIYIGDIFYKCD